MNSCNVGHSYSATLTAATSIKQWSCQQRRRRANKSSLCNSRSISTSSEMNMTVCHLHYAQREEHNNNDDMNSSDCENSYVSPCVFVPDEELDGLTNGHDKSNTLDDTSEIDINTDYIDTDCIDADCITKDCINANFKHANCKDTDHIIQICTVPIHMI
jgi:hypothetical protein